MAQTFNRPAFPHQPPNSGDGTEGGDSWDEVLRKLNLALSTGTSLTAIDFGAFPGSPDTSLTITGLPGILATSTIDGWIVAKDTVDHSADEHWVDPPLVTAGNIVPGVGFTIYATTRDNNRAYGLWSVGWQVI